MKLIHKTFLIFLFTASLFAQEQVRVMSYNLLNYPNNKDVHFQKVIAAINPDALVVLEMIQQSGVNQFLNNVLSADYAAAAVTIKGTNSAGYDGNDCAFYYKPSKLTLIETKTISARTRVISEFKLTNNITKDTLIIFGVHLKAYPQDSIKRADAVTSLRNRTALFNSKSNYLICGDFNIFSSNESAFKKLIDTNSPGYFIDMTNAKGNWTENAAFSNVCTYSAGDLDTRLDMILISPGLQETGGVDYIDKSYKIFGNDDMHFNKPVTYGTNSWFLNDAALGSAVLGASDHLPVYADFVFGASTNVDNTYSVPVKFELAQNYPNPFNPETNIRYSLSTAGFVTLKVYDLLGREVETLINEFQSPGTYHSQFSIFNSQLPTGVYFYQLKVGNFVQTKKMLVIK